MRTHGETKTKADVLKVFAGLALDIEYFEFRTRQRIGVGHFQQVNDKTLNSGWPENGQSLGASFFNEADQQRSQTKIMIRMEMGNIDRIQFKGGCRSRPTKCRQQ